MYQVRCSLKADSPESRESERGWYRRLENSKQSRMTQLNLCRTPDLRIVHRGGTGKIILEALYAFDVFDAIPLTSSRKVPGSEKLSSENYRMTETLRKVQPLLPRSIVPSHVSVSPSRIQVQSQLVHSPSPLLLSPDAPSIPASASSSPARHATP